jgi:DNA-binding PadR family transcriptional regulator
MSLAHAILVSLVECPSSGYDLAKKFDGSVGFFWQATHQQIYRELHRLQDKQWVEAEAVVQENRPDKKLFTVSAAGKQELREWITQPCEINVTKDELMVKIFAGHLVPQDTIEQEINHHRTMHEERLQEYRAIEANFFSDAANLSQALKFQYLALRRGIRLEQEWIDWCDEAIALLAEPTSSTPAESASHG